MDDQLTIFSQNYRGGLSTWLSLVVSLMASFVLSFFSLDVLDEIWDLIESVYGGFLTYSYLLPLKDVTCSSTLEIKNII